MTMNREVEKAMAKVRAASIALRAAVDEFEFAVSARPEPPKRTAGTLVANVEYLLHQDPKLSWSAAEVAQRMVCSYRQALGMLVRLANEGQAKAVVVSGSTYYRAAGIQPRPVKVIP